MSKNLLEAALIALLTLLVLTWSWIFRESILYWIAFPVAGCLVAVLIIRTDWTHEQWRLVQPWYQQLRQTTRVAPTMLSRVSPTTAPAGAIEEQVTMFSWINRHLGGTYVRLAAVLWYLTIVISAIGFSPMGYQVALPFGYTMHDVVRQFAMPFGMALVFLNVLSVRWAPEHLRKIDKNSSMIGFYGMIAVCVLVGIFMICRHKYNVWPEYQVDAGDWLIIGSLLFWGWVDKSIQLGEEMRSSTLKAAAQGHDLQQYWETTAADRQQPAPAMPASSVGGARATQPAPMPGLLANFAGQLHRIGPVPNQTVYIVVDDGGGFEFDVETLTNGRILMLAEQQLAHNMGVSPTLAPPDEPVTADEVA